MFTKDCSIRSKNKKTYIFSIFPSEMVNYHRKFAETVIILRLPSFAKKDVSDMKQKK